MANIIECFLCKRSFKDVWKSIGGIVLTEGHLPVSKIDVITQLRTLKLKMRYCPKRAHSEEVVHYTNQNHFLKQNTLKYKVERRVNNSIYKSTSVVRSIG
jgi:hypothetical protein